MPSPTDAAVPADAVDAVASRLDSLMAADDLNLLYQLAPDPKQNTE